MTTYYGQSFKASYKSNLIVDQASYSLTIDSQLPIDTIMLTSKQRVDILDI
jgi:hypothetical protein